MTTRKPVPQPAIKQATRVPSQAVSPSTSGIPEYMLKDTEEVEEDQPSRSKSNDDDEYFIEPDEGPDGVLEEAAVKFTHPGLRTLHKAFSIRRDKRLPEKEIGGFKWGFRPLGIDELRWVTDKCNEIATLAAMETRTVASPAGVKVLIETMIGALSIAYAVIKDERIPVYELFNLKSKKEVHDPFNPPDDVKYKAANLLHKLARKEWKDQVLQDWFNTYSHLYDQDKTGTSWLRSGAAMYVCENDGNYVPGVIADSKIHCQLCGKLMKQLPDATYVYECPNDGSQLTYPRTDFFTPHCHICGTEMLRVGSEADPLA